ncbi:hypothetical protein ASPWEDRAFT_71944 [Aspergillus wentii DTO 134E9]|uniref:Calcium-dependent cell adhesion molecule 1 membrane-binding domain-containing protein n=1 Tax=Aspergillus wentii DTO 134E9 TaxID=1073089 RepID=A0A1L9R7Q5_ASPWE|nr:uncharacterized protein ASPWEDRAFT_71944 [Aspergillus wentii DTO 134E9]KAI9927525.1 hypothetical protein MW887_003143 [Aspergillus wentii]OJJ30903.1 hypothetical protein ASPWEDRAFT_71944 [Aspergillus wentii DTO 134E9]
MADPNTVAFYSKANYVDLVKTSPLDEVEHQVLGTSYLSCHLGNGTKLLVWNHSNYYEQTEWTTDQSDIPKSSSVQCYQVLKGTTSVIGFRFKDATGAEPKAYSLLLKLAKIGDVTLLSDETDKYAIAGTMPRDGPPVTTALYVRDLKTGVYVVIGSIYFEWDSQNEKVVIIDQEGWPSKQLKHEEDGDNNFTITLISTEA